MKYKITGIFLFFTLFAFGQLKYDYTWILGEDLNNSIDGIETTVLDFNHKPYETYYQEVNYPYNLGLSIGLICDKNTGKLLFYSNGCAILDSSNQIMENGDSINYGYYWEQFCVGDNFLYYPNELSLIVLPNNYFPNQYFLIHQTEKREPNKIVHTPLAYSKIEFSDSKPLGRVTEKNVPFFEPLTTAGFLTAMPHKNKKDWWIVHLLDQTNTYVKILLDSTGFHIHDFQTIGDSIKKHHAQSQFSPDGKMFAWFNKETGLHLFDFDRNTGSLSNYRSLNINYASSQGGLCFSPNSKLLYLFDITKVYQVELDKSILETAYTQVGEYKADSSDIRFQDFLFGMLGPDCRIYITTKLGSKYLSVIENPNEKGIACGFNPLGAPLLFGNGANAIPNFPHFRVDEQYPCDSSVSTLNLNPAYSQIAIYPIPSREIVKIQIPSKGILNIYDLQGKQIIRKAFSNAAETQIDIGGILNGRYIVLFESNHKVYKGDFIKF